MIKRQEATSLINGCDIISKRLKKCLSPIGLLYQFDPNPPHRPKPLPILLVLINGLAPLLSLLVGFLLNYILETFGQNLDDYRAITESTFIIRLVRVFIVYRICACASSFLILLVQHGPMANVMSSSSYFVTEKEQSHFSKLSSTIFLFKGLGTCASYSAIVAFYHMTVKRPVPIMLEIILLVTSILMFFTIVTQSSPIMITCYLGSALGQHVENFSKIYVDTMFDQFMKTIEADGSNSGNFLVADQTYDSPQECEIKRGSSCLASCCGCCGYLCLIYKFFVRCIKVTIDFFVALGARLNSRKYPELPEMKMTKLSSTQNIQVSETMRMANSHLIRIRLRRTQVMLSELRDVVSDINKTSSPIVMMYLIHETMLIILITTASIQAKVYKSIDFLIMPTVSATVGLIISVIYICTCLDATMKQLKLMINKLFDFIIMNHRVQSTGKRAIDSLSRQQLENAEVCLITGTESSAINETWSQFQYTRKLANTIHFTIGGVLPVTRRLVLSILGHILSAVFISIEIMSIVDTSPGSGHGAELHGKMKPMAVNMSSSTAGGGQHGVASWS